MASLKEIKGRIDSVKSTLKIDQAQYNELESFSKFSSEMDKVTAMAIDKGRKNNQLLIQPQYSPMAVGEQIAILYCGTHALMRDIPIERVRDFQNDFISRMRADHQETLDTLAEGRYGEELTSVIEKVAAEVSSVYAQAE